MIINHLRLIKQYAWIIPFAGLGFVFHNPANAQATPTETIQKIYSFYQPQPDNDTNDIGFDRTSTQNSQFFSPDFLSVIKEDDKLTSEQGDASIIDYDFLCNCQDTIDGIIVRNIQTLQQTQQTARVKVAFDFIINGSDSFQKDDPFSNDHPGQQHTYFNLINLHHHWLIDDVTDADNVGIKQRWKEQLHKFYNSSIQ